MRLTRALLTATLVTLWVNGCGGVPTPEPETLPDGVSIAYALPKAVSLHAPVPLSITVTNGLANAVHVDLGTDGFGRSGVIVTRPNGTRVAVDLTRAPEGVTEYATWPGYFDLPSRERQLAEVVLNQSVDFSALGRYRVDMRFDGAVQGPNDSAIAVERTPVRLTVQVLPRNAQALDDLAADLVDEILLSDAERALYAMKKLRYLDDPVAVRYWNRLLSTRMDGEARRALDRLARRWKFGGAGNGGVR